MIPAEETKISGIPAIVWGGPSRGVYLYVHGQGGNKEEADTVSEIAWKHGYQTISVDLPEHGSRKGERNAFVPWRIVPELTEVMRFAKERWESVSLFANSIGAWFSMLSFGGESLEKSLFVSPILDMERLMRKMMRWAGVSLRQLEKERLIPTSFGQTLSWEYWEYILSHPISSWTSEILYGGNDDMTEREEVERFARRFHCGLTVMEKGEHWFHTREEMDVMRSWLERNMGNDGGPKRRASGMGRKAR